ncbi:hypothetical protein MD484_g8544, partial [Candolleomyces efflorescens]
MPSPKGNSRAQPEPGPSDEAEDVLNGTVTFRISKKELLSLQIRAFLDASDEVDLTPEVAEDLLQSIPQDDENEDIENEQDGQSDDDEDEDMDGVEVTAKDGEISFSTVFNPNNAADNVWTKQEVRHILHHLKEREDAETLIANAKKILILTGAGISVSCGIPDFRSRDGLYAKLKERGEYDLDDPQQMLARFLVPSFEYPTDFILRFDINYFRENPAAPSSAPAKKKRKPKPKKGRKEWEESESEDDHLPPPLYPAGIMKPDITFFGEKLDDVFEKTLEEDRDQVDLLLVIGTSLKVAPVADILSHIPHSFEFLRQILINKTPIRHINPDIILLGDADSVIEYLNREPSKKSQGSKRPVSPMTLSYTRVGETHISLFPGAEGGSWLEEFKQKSLGGVDSSKSDDGESSQNSGSEDGRGKKRQRVR